MSTFHSFFMFLYYLVQVLFIDPADFERHLNLQMPQLWASKRESTRLTFLGLAEKPASHESIAGM